MNSFQNRHKFADLYIRKKKKNSFGLMDLHFQPIELNRPYLGFRAPTTNPKYVK